MKTLAYMIVLLFATSIPSCAGQVTVGAQAPAFTVFHGEAEALASPSLAGSVLVVTYETKEAVEKNRAFKKAVLAFCASRDNVGGTVMPVPVINCFKYIWPASSICATRVEKHSQKEKLRIYTDRDGRMFEDFGIRDNESNIFIIDRQGIIRFAKAGKVEKIETEAIMKLLRRLAAEQPASVMSNE